MERSVGQRPSEEFLDFKKEIFDAPSMNTLILLIGPKRIGRRLRMRLNRYEALRIRFTEMTPTGDQRQTFGKNFKRTPDGEIEIDNKTKLPIYDKTYGPNHASYEELHHFIWLEGRINNVLTLAMGQAPKAQQLFHETFKKLQFGNATHTTQRTVDEKEEGFLAKRPGAQPAQRGDEGEAKEQGEEFFGISNIGDTL